MLSEQRNRNLLRFVGVLYFLGGFSGASFGRFSTIFYLSPPRNFNAGQIGLIEAVGPPCALVGNTVFGWLADKLQRKKLVTLLTRIVTTATITAFLIPQLSCCFSSVMIVMGVTAFFSVGGGVLDAYTLDLLGQKRRGEYGKYRLWLAVSWGVGNVVMGLVAEHNFDYNFIGYCALNSLTVVLMAALLPARLVDEERRIAKRKADIAALANAAHLRAANGGGSLDGGGGGTWSSADTLGTGLMNGHASSDATQLPSNSNNNGGLLKACTTLCTLRFTTFLLECAFIGFCMCIVESFLFVYLQNELDGSPTLCGLSVGVTVVFELPIFQYGAQLLSCLGHDLMCIGALLAYAVRVYGYTLLTPHTVWWVLALEVLHGITFGLAWTAAVDKVKAEFPEEWNTSGQMLLSTFQNLIGRMTGSLVGGFFFLHGSFLGRTGGRALYTLAAVLSGGVLAAHLLTSALLKLCGSRTLWTPPPHHLLEVGGAPVASVN